MCTEGVRSQQTWTPRGLLMFLRHVQPANIDPDRAFHVSWRRKLAGGHSALLVPLFLWHDDAFDLRDRHPRPRVWGLKRLSRDALDTLQTFLRDSEKTLKRHFQGICLSLFGMPAQAATLCGLCRSFRGITTPLMCLTRAAAGCALTNFVGGPSATAMSGR
eukprot:215419-Chlamydomonas_euryale.AAC.6